MRILAAPLLVTALAIAVPAWGDATSADPRIQTLARPANGLLRLMTSPGTIQTILFAEGERVQSVVLTNPDAYKVAVTGSGDVLSLHALGYLPPVIMSVLTDRTSYQFELAPTREGEVPTVVRIGEMAAIAAGAAPAALPALPSPPQLEGFSYRLKGRDALRPTSISDDGKRTYLAWGPDQAMPAVFTLGPGGKEEIVDGYMRGGTYVIDRVFPEFVFRIDSNTASASRIQAKPRRAK